MQSLLSRLSNPREAWASASPRHRVTFAAWGLLATVTALIAVDVVVRGTSATVDGVAYLSIAEGLRHLELTSWSGGPVGFWPYGYPLALAALGVRAQAMIDLGFVVQLTALAGMAVYLVLIARRLDFYRPSGAYLIAAAALLASPPVLAATRLLESEMLFTFVGLAFFYHVVVQNLLTQSVEHRAGLAIGTAAVFLMPNIRFIGGAAPLGLAAGAAILFFLRDPEARELARRARLPIIGGFGGTATAMMINLLTTHTVDGGLVHQVDVLRSTVLFSAATFWELLVAGWHFPLFRYEIAAGAVVAIVLAVLTVRTARMAWVGGGQEYRRFTVWSWSGIGAYAAVLYWRGFTTLLDPIAPRFFLPILPIAVMWLVFSYVVALKPGHRTSVLRADRIAGAVVLALWLASFSYSVAVDLAQPSREDDLSAIRLTGQDRACLARTSDAPASARISNNASFLWIATDGRVTSKQASYESHSPNDFYFIDTRAEAVGDLPPEILAGTHGTLLCSGEHLVIERRIRPG